MSDFDDIDFSATMEASFDASESGTDYVPPVNDDASEAPEEVHVSDDGGTVTTADSSDEQVSPTEVDSPLLTAPDRWSAEAKEQFGTLPREAQDIVLQREHDVETYLTKRTQELSEQSERYRDLDAVLAPRRQALVMNYGTEANALNALLAYSDKAEQDPVGFAQMLLQQRGIDPRELIPSEDEHSDPEITLLRQKVAQLEGMQNQSLQQQHQSHQQELQATVDAFEHAKDEKGEPAHPHFAQVRNHMAAIMAQGLVADMQQAYDQAVYANPETRSALMESDANKRIAEAKAKAAAAEKAASVRPRGTNGPFVNTPAATQEDTMSAVYDRMN